MGLYAGGLSSFVGGSEEIDPEEDTTATAGMELTVQGSFLRPLEFFYGQGQLMGHVWSGTASEKTPAYQVSMERIYMYCIYVISLDFETFQTCRHHHYCKTTNKYFSCTTVSLLI